MERSIELPNSMGSLTYRIPNVIEQLRFFSNSGWYREENQKDYTMRILGGLEAAREFIIKVDGKAKSIDKVLEDRDNLDCLIEFVHDIASIKKKVSDDEKKR